MRVLAGTSGYGYPAWKGRFYPAKIPSSRLLAAYAARLPTVEINATFYRAPEAATVATWRAQVPESFVFALKGPREVTHLLRLARAGERVTRFLGAAAELGPTLGPVLWQLPPSMREDLPLLREFLALLPRGGRAAFEFRHDSWYRDAVLAALADAGAALCVADDVSRPGPLVATAPFGYLRMRQPHYDGAALARWARLVLAQPWSEAFVFFMHEDEALGPRYAMRFAEAASESPGATL